MKKENYQESFKWAVYGMCVASLLFVLVATYFIVRIIDGNWTSWQLPAILLIIFFVAIPISAMFTSLGDIKREIEKEAK